MDKNTLATTANYIVNAVDQLSALNAAMQGKSDAEKLELMQAVSEAWAFQQEMA